MKDTVLSNMGPFFLKDSFSTSNKLVAKAILMTGMYKNLFLTSHTYGSRTHVRIIQNLPTLSLDLSINSEKGPLDIEAITFLCVVRN